MNLNHINGELEIFDNSQVGGDSEESLLHAWMNEEKKLVFIIGEDCEMSQEKHEGKIYYSVTRKKSKKGNKMTKERKLKGFIVKNKKSIKQHPHHFINGDGFYIEFENGCTGFKENDNVEIIIRKVE